MWPVTRSTESHGPGCQIQCGATSLGRASLSRSARRTVKVRSVMSWISPVVHSFWRSSTKRGRILRVEVSSALVSGVASGWVYGTLRNAPSVTVWTLGMAAESRRDEKSAQKVSKNNVNRRQRTFGTVQDGSEVKLKRGLAGWNSE